MKPISRFLRCTSNSHHLLSDIRIEIGHLHTYTHANIFFLKMCYVYTFILRILQRHVCICVYIGLETFELFDIRHQSTAVHSKNKMKMQWSECTHTHMHKHKLLSKRKYKNHLAENAKQPNSQSHEPHALGCVTTTTTTIRPID